MVIMKMLDAGALGIICPMINTREQAEQFVGYCRYAPLGERSFGPTRAISVHGVDYPSVANDQVIALAMIETRTALLNVDSIVATPNLTGVYIGPSDLALSLGFVPKLDHDEAAVLDAIKTILAAAHGAGVNAPRRDGLDIRKSDTNGYLRRRDAPMRQLLFRVGSPTSDLGANEGAGMLVTGGDAQDVRQYGIGTGFFPKYSTLGSVVGIIHSVAHLSVVTEAPAHDLLVRV